VSTNPHPAEPHTGSLSSKLNWLRAGVLGANDGIVSTAGIVVGVAASATSPGPILTAGVAGLVPENGAVRVHFAPGSGSSELLGWLAAQRAEVEEFRHMVTPLEDVFVRVVEEAGGTARDAVNA